MDKAAYEVNGMCETSEFGSIPDWDTSSLTLLDNAFKNYDTFNGDISKWDTSQVTSMNYDVLFGFCIQPRHIFMGHVESEVHELYV